ncbi:MULTISPECIES: gluconate 5-dehydrogenase [Yersinia pseudotuberculosis complex]|nr:MULTISPECIES: gluconate 5-dehydrogenase [Yersinia pseudotuberculosis complex]
MDVFTASLRSACSLRRGHFVNNLLNEIFFRFYSSPWTVK